MEDLKFVEGVEPWLALGCLLVVFAGVVALGFAAWYVFERLRTGTMTWNRIPAMPEPPGREFLWVFVAIVVAWTTFSQGLYFGVLWLPFVYKFIYRLDLRELWGTGRYSLTRLVGTAGWVYFAVIAIIIPLSFVLTLLVKLLGAPFMPQQAVQAIFHIKDPRIFFAMLSVAVLIAPCAEEILFRGTILPLLKRYLHPVAALMLTSAVFAALHLPFNLMGHGETLHVLAGSLPMLVQLFALALVLGGLYEHTGSLPLSITLHTIFNFSTTMLLVFLKLVTV